MTSRGTISLSRRTLHHKFLITYTEYYDSDWMNLAPNRVQFRAPAYMVRNQRISGRVGKFSDRLIGYQMLRKDSAAYTGIYR